MKAEIQVWAVLEHAWAGFVHDRVYKRAFYSILSHKELGVDQPENIMQDWIEDAVDEAIQTGLFKTREQCNISSVSL